MAINFNKDYYLRTDIGNFIVPILHATFNIYDSRNSFLDPAGCEYKGANFGNDTVTINMSVVASAVYRYSASPALGTVNFTDISTGYISTTHFGTQVRTILKPSSSYMPSDTSGYYGSRNGETEYSGFGLIIDDYDNAMFTLLPGRFVTGDTSVDFTMNTSSTFGHFEGTWQINNASLDYATTDSSGTKIIRNFSQTPIYTALIPDFTPYQKTITVKWDRPVDGVELTDTFDITVVG